jgi:antitoxin ParD1/3/4
VRAISSLEAPRVAAILNSMSAPRPTSVDLPEDLREFVDEQIRSGRYASAAEVLRDAFAALRHRHERLDGLRSALGIGIAQLDNGDYMEGTPGELAQALRDARPFKG